MTSSSCVDGSSDNNGFAFFRFMYISNCCLLDSVLGERNTKAI